MGQYFASTLYLPPPPPKSNIGCVTARDVMTVNMGIHERLAYPAAAVMHI